ncbi:unnamed protein product [Strongylus vulgaris]|uniref:Uncharacterized protein n=1 Tax=Strongylus vulgaris TaxID=40348 RepID=A0A3P7IUV9_STRVU|nr:unnamed protein product [Strongylus vulgaris]
MLEARTEIFVHVTHVLLTSAPVAAPQSAQPQQAEETMDVSTAQVDNLDELINNPELLQQIIDDLPGGEKV